MLSNVQKITIYHSYIYFIILVKLVFLFFMIYYRALKHKKKQDTPTGKWALLWKERTESIFIYSMAFLCIIIFNPFKKGLIIIDEHTRVLLFIYGFVILMTRLGWD